MLACFERAGATFAARAADAEEADALFAARRLAYPALERLGPVLTEDVCVPRAAVPEMLRRIQETGRRHDTTIANIAHAGDGNLHPLLITPPDDEAARERAQQPFGRIIADALDLGGTVTGEHGVGLLKRDGLASTRARSSEPRGLRRPRRDRWAARGRPRAVAGPGTVDLARATARGGILTLHGLLSGQPTIFPAETLPDLWMRGYTLFAMTYDEQRLRRAGAFVGAGLRSGDFAPRVDRVFTGLDSVVEAHTYLESNAQVGKIVLTP